MHTTQLRSIGHSVGVIIPKELLKELNMRKGDKFYIQKTADGILEFSPYDAERERHMEIIRDIVAENRELFKKLAE